MIERLQGSRAALDESVRAQRQLVADASHELRTPITSLRTNIEVLMAGDALSEDDRHRLLADVLEQSEELSALIGDVIELARGDLPDHLGRGHPARSTRRRVPDARASRLPRRPVRELVRARGRRRRPGAPGPRGQQPARQRRAPFRGRRPRRGDRRRARGAGARPRHRHRPGGPAVRVRPVLPRRQLARPPGQRPGTRDRPPDRAPARRVGGGGQRARRRRDLHACGCRP